MSPSPPSPPPRPWSIWRPRSFSPRALLTLEWHGQIQDFVSKSMREARAPKSRTEKTSAPVGWLYRGCLRGMCPPQKWRKKLIFEANSSDLVHSFCLRHPISTKNREGAHPTPEWLPYHVTPIFPFLSPSFLSSFPLSFPFFLFSLLSLSFFWHPFSNPWGRDPLRPPGYAPAQLHVLGNSC